MTVMVDSMSCSLSKTCRDSTGGRRC